MEVVGSTEIDLLISDLGLPDRSGLDLIRELRQRGLALKAIALSGFGREEDIQRSKEAGFAAHLTKPVDFETLLRAVETILQPTT
jgi:CheY-like chemotaxis protein